MSFIKLNLSDKDIIVNTDMICYIEEKKKEYIVYFANNFCTLYISKEDACAAESDQYGKRNLREKRTEINYEKRSNVMYRLRSQKLQPDDKTFPEFALLPTWTRKCRKKP